MTKRVVGYTSGFALILALVFGIALAQNGQGNGTQPHKGKQGFGRGRRGAGMMFSQLNLSDQQKSQLKDIFHSQRASAQPLRDELKTKRQALRAATTASNFNEDEVKAAAQDLASTQANLMVIRAETMRKAFAVLTPDQQAKLKDLRAQRMERFKQRKAAAGSSAHAS